MLCDVYVYIKIREPDNLTSGATGRGDIAYIYPRVDSAGNLHHQGNLTLDTFRPVRMQLNIPCGNQYLNLKQNCGTCKTNTPAQCEHKRILRPVWGGSIDQVPYPIEKKRYKLKDDDIKAMWGAAIETDITKIDSRAVYASADISMGIASMLVDKTGA